MAEQLILKGTLEGHVRAFPPHTPHDASPWCIPFNHDATLRLNFLAREGAFCYIVDIVR